MNRFQSLIRIHFFLVNVYVINKLENAYLITSLVLCASLIIKFLKSNDKWFILLAELSDFKNFGVPKKFKRINKLQDFFTAFFAIYVSIGGIIFILSTILRRGICEKNKQPGERNICGMATTFYVPFDVHSYPIIKWIFILIEYLGGVFVLQFGVLMVCMVVGCVSLVITKIDHLQDLLKNVFKSGNEVAVKMKLRHCLRYHNHILK